MPSVEELKEFIPSFLLRRIPSQAKAWAKEMLVPPQSFPIREYLLRRGVDLDKMAHYRKERFPETDLRPWLDAPGTDRILRASEMAGAITTEQAEACRQYSRDGFIVLKGLIDHAMLDRLWAAFLAGIESKKVPLEPERPGEDTSEWGRVLNVHDFVPEMGELLRDERIRSWVSLLLGRAAIPFQTIPSFRGSEQPAHSDAIHMSTFPLGFLSAVWIAFEDIHPDSGPLVYYPGSHRLPYYLSEDVGIGPAEYQRTGRSIYVERYEPFIQEVLRRERLKPAYFCPKKGDVLIWHHNLLHGGSPRKDRSQTRKALVCHYFGKNVVCYHDLSGELRGVY